MRLMKSSLMTSSITNCSPPTIPNTTACFTLIPSMCFFRLTIRNIEEFRKAYSRNTHCSRLIGTMQSRVAGMKQKME